LVSIGGSRRYIRIHRITAQFILQCAAIFPCAAVGRAFVNIARSEVAGKEGKARIQQVIRVGERRRVAVVAPEHPQIRRLAQWSPAIGHQQFSIITGIHGPRQNQLPLVVDALDASGVVFAPGERRQQHGGEDGDDRNDNEQFDKGKSTAGRKPFTA